LQWLDISGDVFDVGGAGRVDDVINVSGHRIGTAEVESALVNHPACAEAAVVPVEHPIKGQGIYAFITLMEVSCAPSCSFCAFTTLWSKHALCCYPFQRFACVLASKSSSAFLRISSAWTVHWPLASLP